VKSRSFASQRFYRVLLFAYPRSFRRDYGELMAQAFGDRLREKGAPRAWGLVVTDLALSLPQQLMEVSLMSQRWMAGVAAAGTALILSTMFIGAGSPITILSLGIGLFAGILAALSFWSAKRNGRPSEFSYGGVTPKLWKWWTVLAVVLGALYVVAATAQLISDPKGTNVGALGIALGFAALIAGGLALRSRSHVSGNWMVAIATVPSLAFFWIVWPAAVGLAIIFGSVAEVTKAAPRTAAPA
jgi:hypothetical protein